MHTHTHTPCCDRQGWVLGNPSQLSVTTLTPLMSVSKRDGTTFRLALLLTVLLAATRLCAGVLLLLCKTLTAAGGNFQASQGWDLKQVFFSISFRGVVAF